MKQCSRRRRWRRWRRRSARPQSAPSSAAGHVQGAATACSNVFLRWQRVGEVGRVGKDKEAEDREGEVDEQTNHADTVPDGKRPARRQTDRQTGRVSRPTDRPTGRPTGRTKRGQRGLDKTSSIQWLRPPPRSMDGGGGFPRKNTNRAGSVARTNRREHAQLRSSTQLACGFCPPGETRLAPRADCMRVCFLRSSLRPPLRSVPTPTAGPSTSYSTVQRAWRGLPCIPVRFLFLGGRGTERTADAAY